MLASVNESRFPGLAPGFTAPLERLSPQFTVNYFNKSMCQSSWLGRIINDLALPYCSKTFIISSLQDTCLKIHVSCPFICMRHGKPKDFTGSKKFISMCHTLCTRDYTSTISKCWYPSHPELRFLLSMHVKAVRSGSKLPISTDLTDYFH